MPVEQVEAIRALASERMRVAIDLAVFMGPRRGDLLALRRENLTAEGILFTQSKIGRAPFIDWSEELRAIIATAKALKPRVPGDYLLRT